MNQSTGTATLLGNLTGNGDALLNALTFDATGNGYSVRRAGAQSFLMGVNVENLTYAQIGEISVGGSPVTGVTAFAFVTAVPEPATVGLTLLVVGVSVWYYWRLRIQIRRTLEHDVCAKDCQHIHGN